jgi:hypothetical protein
LFCAETAPVSALAMAAAAKACIIFFIVTPVNCLIVRLQQYLLQA